MTVLELIEAFSRQESELEACLICNLMEFFFQFARLKLVLLKSHIRREFIYIKKFLCLGQAIKSLGDSCLHHSKFVERDATRPCFYLVWTKFSRVI